MTDGSPVPRPPSLREVLDAGCDLTETGVWLEGLAEDLYQHLPFLPPKERAKKAAFWRASFEDLAANGEKSKYLPMWADGSRGVKRGAGTFQQYVWLELWRAEVYEDEDLAERLRRALPAEVTAQERAQVDLYRRPHPLQVRMPEQWWNCDNCGASFDDGEQEAVVVTYREGHSNLPYDITYCFDCIGLVAEVGRPGSI